MCEKFEYVSSWGEKERKMKELENGIQKEYAAASTGGEALAERAKGGMRSRKGAFDEVENSQVWEERVVS